MSYWNYWGKAKPSTNSTASYHPLALHSLDVAAVGRIYLHKHPRLQQFVAQCWGIDSTTAVDWLTFVLALHDLGKFAESFQSQRADVFTALHGRPPKLNAYTVRHDSLGAWLWGDGKTKHHLSTQLSQSWPWLKGCRIGVQAAIYAVTGHHGMPPIAAQTLSGHFSRADETAALQFAQSMVDLLLPQSSRDALQKIDAEHFEIGSQKASWWVAGIAVLADWLGSNTDFFAYHDGSQDPAKYWQYAQAQAALALDCSGVLPPQSHSALPMTALFNHLTVATPLQAWAHQSALPNGPQLHILEDVTGAGKTEAAVILAQRLLANSHSDGLFFALPTMATANAMYERLASVGGKLFSGPASTVLAHGQRNLNDLFNAGILPKDPSEDDPKQLDETASARCTAWLADSNKKALLANVGVGTIDQVLLVVLHAKHQSLRLLGLFGKVLIVDEVHACDAYVLRLLCQVLRFHAASGGSAILLSATLPQAMKQQLLAAHAEGLGADAPTLCAKDFPLATSFSSAGAVETGVATRPEVARTVQVQTLGTAEAVMGVIQHALALGQCVAWIRNTIADVLDAYDQCLPVLSAENILIFHARFAMGDRLDKETELKNRFGASSQHAQRKGHLLLASQVAEQSLDVDFDLLISDLAPIDRLIQRAGRMHRHVRDALGNPKPTGADERGPATFIVFAPEWQDQPTSQWFKAAFPKAQKVYGNHAQLWLTQQQLRKGHYQMPQDARPLIEAVYGQDIELPTGLQASALTAEGDAISQRGMAHDNGLKFSGGYTVGNVGDWWRDTLTPTRLGEVTTIVRLAVWDEETLQPLCNGTHAWALSQVRVYQKYLNAECLPAAAKTAAEALKATLPDSGKWSVLLVLQGNPAQGWLGQALDNKNAVHNWRYDRKFGLRKVQ